MSYLIKQISIILIFCTPLFACTTITERQLNPGDSPYTGIYKGRMTAYFTSVEGKNIDPEIKKLVGEKFSVKYDLTIQPDGLVTAATGIPINDAAAKFNLIKSMLPEAKDMNCDFSNPVSSKLEGNRLQMSSEITCVANPQGDRGTISVKFQGNLYVIGKELIMNAFGAATADLNGESFTLHIKRESKLKRIR